MFLGGDSGVTRNYLRLLIDKTVVTGPRVEVIGKAAETIALMSMPPAERNKVNRSPEVRTSVGGWLQL